MRFLWIVAAATAIGPASPVEAQTDPTSMLCTFQRGYVHRTGERVEVVTHPRGDERYCPVRLALHGRQLSGREECSDEKPIAKDFDVVVIRERYPGNIVALWKQEFAVQLWAISFPRREVAVTQGLAANYTEGSVTWLRCE
jgi:hypothetical protein